MNPIAVSNEDRFATNVSSIFIMVGQCIDIMNENWADNKKIDTGILKLAGNFIDSMDKKQLVQQFILKSHKFWNEIKERNENFFLEHSSGIFGHIGNGIAAKYIDSFSTIFRERNRDGDFIINEDLRDDLWQAFQALVKISIKYIHTEREMEDGEYKYEFMNDIIPDIMTTAKEWKITLV